MVTDFITIIYVLVIYDKMHLDYIKPNIPTYYNNKKINN